jgi:hypothetical protein
VRLALGILAAVCATLALAGCNGTAEAVRYRLTIEVDDNGVPRTGAAVQEEHCTFNDGIFKGMGNALNCGVKGEAVVVDLGEKGALFVLLIRDTARRQSGGGFGALEGGHRDLLDPVGLTAEAMRRIGAVRGANEVPVDSLPLLVRFRDPNDPRTVARVDSSDLSASFGSGVQLTRATAEVAVDPLTTGIEKRLPWLAGGWLEKPLVPHPGPPRPASDVAQVEDLLHGDFWRFMQ